MTCNGSQHCKAGEKAIVVITGASIKDEFFTENVPVCVELNNNSNNKCWRFYGTNNGVVTFEHFACGENAYYQTDSSLSNNGAWLVVDGQVQNGTSYYYWSGNFNNTTYTRGLEQVTTVNRVGQSSSGNCDACLTGSQWTLKIKDKKFSSFYQKTFNEKPNVTVSCNGCPPNHIKCNCPQYPGYCCIPCNEITGGIASITATLRSIK